MGVDIRLCSERKGSASRVCNERNVTCENTFVANVTKSKQIDAPKMICGNEFATHPTSKKQVRFFIGCHCNKIK